MISQMDIPQWQVSQPVTCTSLPMMPGVEATPQQWQFCQPTTWPSQPVTSGIWMSGNAVAAQGQPHPIQMVSMPSQTSLPANNCQVAGVYSGVVVQSLPDSAAGDYC